VRFNDHAPPPPAGLVPPQFVRVGPVVVTQRPDLPERAPTIHHAIGGQLPFAGTPHIGRWRTVVVEATADGVTVKWRDDAGGLATVAAHTAARTQEDWAEARRTAERVTPGSGAILRDWHPRGAIGVLSFKASVAVRNVTLEPLP
jgi:hypothetical protein